MILMQLDSARDFLSIEYVTSTGVLLVFIGYLIWNIKELKKDIKEKDDIIIGFMEKWYTLSTKLYDYLRRKGE
jgi:hypothetical protein